MEIGDEKTKELSESVESLDKEFRERVARHQPNRRLSVPRIGTDLTLTFTQQRILDSKGSDNDNDDDGNYLANDADDDDDDLDVNDSYSDGEGEREGLDGANRGATGGLQRSIIKVEDFSEDAGEPSVPGKGVLTMAALEKLYQQGIERQNRGEVEEDIEEDDMDSDEEARKQRRDTELLLNIMETENEKRQRRGSWKSVWDEDDPEEDSKINEDIESDPIKRLLWAAENNEMETARELIESKAALVGVQDDDGYTPLHRASYNGHTVMVEFLLERGADMCARTTDGWQPIHCAARWNNPEVASLLLQAGCDVNAMTNGGQTALHLAASNAESEEVMNMLLMHRYIDVTIRNGADETAYDIARRTGRLSYLFEIREPHMLPSSSSS